jgi:integrase
LFFCLFFGAKVVKIFLLQKKNYQFLYKLTKNISLFELLNILNVEDIDLEKRIISISKSYQRLDGKDVITPPKTPKSNRKITIPPFLAEELKEYCSHLYGIMPNERMFRFTKSYMEHEIVRGIKETGVKRIRIHDLRHSHASLLVELGFQPLAIAERLGHEKIETTLNTYSHLYPNKQAELANRLELENEEDNL